MEDARYTQLARSLIHYSCDLTVGETVLIESIGAPIEFVVALIREAKASGATPLVSLKDDLIMRELARQYSDCDIKMMADSMRPLADRMANAKEVRVVGPGETDLAFSIKGIGHYKSVGRHNLPDGEIFTAPVKNSVNGQIHFNVSSTYYGATFDDIRLKMRDGKIVDATASNLHKLAQILDQDDGSRFLGEFAFGVHPQIRRPIRDILFDEKL